MAAAPATTASPAELRGLLEAVCDPEIPILTIADLGVLRELRVEGDTVVVVITPTYSGCPAMNTIESDIRVALAAVGYERVRIETRLAPAWTTDWLSESARAKLLEVGIAPPAASSKRALTGAAVSVTCPQCGAQETEQISEFGSTACKALYRCRSCLEPFDYFKCL